MPLSAKQRKFITEYIELGLSNATEAARRAGYSSSTCVSAILRSPLVKEAIENVRKELEKNFTYSAFECFKKLQMVQEKALERKKIIRGRNDEPDTEIDYPDLQAFLKAEEMKAKIFGLLKENINHNAQMAVVSMGKIQVEGKALELNVGEYAQDANSKEITACEQKTLPVYDNILSRFDE